MRRGDRVRKQARIFQDEHVGRVEAVRVWRLRADSTTNSSIEACAPTGEAPGLGGWGERVVWTFFQSILSASAWKVTVLRTFEV